MFFLFLKQSYFAVFWGIIEEIILKILQKHNNFIRTMCIFNNSENSRDCEHAECQIIKTIKKINKPIFKKPRSKTPLHRERDSSMRCSRDSWEEDERMMVREAPRREEPRYKTSDKTIPSFNQLEGSQKIYNLEREVQCLREELFTLRVLLSANGLL